MNTIYVLDYKNKQIEFDDLLIFWDLHGKQLIHDQLDNLIFADSNICLSIGDPPLSLYTRLKPFVSVVRQHDLMLVS